MLFPSADNITAILQRILVAVREKEGLCVASNSLREVLSVIRTHASVNKLSPSGMKEELIVAVKVDFISVCFEM